jgi:hypothetical protein
VRLDARAVGRRDQAIHIPGDVGGIEVRAVARVSVHGGHGKAWQGGHHKDGTEPSRFFARSWFGLPHAAARQDLAHLCEQGVDAAVDVEWRRVVQDRRDLAGGQVILEAESQQQPVGWVETGERCRKRPCQLGGTELRFGIDAGFRMQLVYIDLIGDVIDEPAPGRMRLAGLGRVLLQPAVALANVIEAETTSQVVNLLRPSSAYPRKRRKSSARNCSSRWVYASIAASWSRSTLRAVCSSRRLWSSTNDFHAASRAAGSSAPSNADSSDGSTIVPPWSSDWR